MRYRFAELEFEFDIKDLPIVEDNLTQDFVSHGGGRVDFRYFERPLTQELLLGSELIRHESSYELLRSQKGVFLMNHWAMCRKAFGFFPSDLMQDTPVYVNPEMRAQLPIAASYFLSVAGLHRKLMLKGAVVLHASYVDIGGKALLFLGPSGTGKSTQAELWCRHENACIINGDRALLRKHDGRWMAYGFPCCGSSAVSINRTLPVAALVLLRQGREDRIEQLTASRKLCALTAATELYPWEAWEVEQAFLLAQSLCCDLPAFQYTCTRELSSVQVLKAYLETVI